MLARIIDHKTHILNNVKIDFNGCWIWQKSLHKDGYGNITYNEKANLVHRVAYQEFKGEVGELYVLHKCDVPACCNPDHLFLGTQDDNVKDCVNKERDNCGIGERNSHDKLTESDVLEIIEKYKTGNYSQKELAEEFGINDRQISNIVTGKNWKHLHEKYKITLCNSRKRIDLTKFQKMEIIEKYKTGDYTKMQLSKEYGVERKQIYRLIKRYLQHETT